MALSEDHLKELAERLANRIRDVEARAKPSLRLVDLPPRPVRDVGMDPLQREAHYKRIRYMAGAYKLQWLVDQACFECLDIEQLSDDDLVQLHADMDRARECPENDVSYEEAGLVRRHGKELRRA
jgi:hypothetical protein